MRTLEHWRAEASKQRPGARGQKDRRPRTEDLELLDVFGHKSLFVRLLMIFVIVVKVTEYRCMGVLGKFWIR